VLVADDDEMQWQLVVQTLRAAGLVPIAVPSGDLVLDTARAERPDLVLLDVNMPGLDGYGVCRQLKAAPDVSQIPVMFITSRGGLDERLAGLTLGADHYLIKPVDMPELLLRIQLLQSRRAGERDRPASRRSRRRGADVRPLRRSRAGGSCSGARRGCAPAPPRGSAGRRGGHAPRQRATARHHRPLQLRRLRPPDARYVGRAGM
jgi:DNA-binding response OmpR family regulator